MARKKHVLDRPTKKEISFKLTQKDKAEIAEKWSKLNSSYGEIKIEFSKIRSEFKGRLEKIEMETNQLAKWVQDGEKREIVSVIERRDYNKRIVSVIYEGKTIETRDMTPEECQMEMPIEDIKKEFKTEETVADVIKMETSKKTKRTPLNQPVS